MKFERGSTGGTGGVNVRPTTAAGTSLDRLVRDIKQKVSVPRGCPLRVEKKNNNNAGRMFERNNETRLL